MQNLIDVKGYAVIFGLIALLGLFFAGLALYFKGKHAGHGSPDFS
jgi:hypothetical protein